MIMKRKMTAGAMAGAFLMASAPLWAQNATTVDPDMGTEAGQNTAGAGQMSAEDIATLRTQIQALQRASGIKWKPVRKPPPKPPPRLRR